LMAASDYAYGELQAAEEMRASTPDVSEAVNTAEGEVKKAAALEKLLSLRSAAERQIEKAAESATTATIARSEADTAIHNLMADAGFCPLCNQGVV